MKAGISLSIKWPLSYYTYHIHILFVESSPQGHKLTTQWSEEPFVADFDVRCLGLLIF